MNVSSKQRRDAPDPDSMRARIRRRLAFHRRVLIAAADHLDLEPETRQMNRQIQRQLRAAPSVRVIKLFDEENPALAVRDGVTHGEMLRDRTRSRASLQARVNCTAKSRMRSSVPAAAARCCATVGGSRHSDQTLSRLSAMAAGSYGSK